MTSILGHRNNPHQLRCWPDSFKAVWGGKKRGDFRRDDRTFEEGQFIRLREWDPLRESYTGQLLLTQITHVERHPDFDIPEGFVVLTIYPIALESSRPKRGQKTAYAGSPADRHGMN